MQNIPFENLDVIVRREINLDFENLFNKIVKKGIEAIDKKNIAYSKE